MHIFDLDETTRVCIYKTTYMVDIFVLVKSTHNLRRFPRIVQAELNKLALSARDNASCSRTYLRINQI